MTTNRFRAGSVWGSRADSPTDLGRRMLRSIEVLSGISPYFGPWWLVDRTDASGIQLAEARGNMTAIVERGVVRDDYGEPEPESGYRIIAATDPGGPRSVDFHVHGGEDNPFNRFPNSCAFATEYGEIPDPAIVAYPVFKAVILGLAPIWEVAWTQAYSSDLMKHWPRPSATFDLSWMTYLSAPFAARVMPPKSVLSERTPGGGLLLIAAEETFDVANPRHMAGARAIREALTPLNEPNGS